MLNEWLSSVLLRFKAIWKRKQLDRDLKEEIEFHLAMRQQKLRSLGTSDRDAHDRAYRAFGNPAKLKEDTRMLWTFRWFEDLRMDVLHAGRSLRKSPGLASVVVLSLALGIGANTAIFSLIDAIMLRLLPINRPEQLVQLQRQLPQGGGPNFTNPLWEAIRDHQDVFSGAFAWSSTRFDLARGGAVQYVRGVFVSGGYFDTLGIKPAAGRLIVVADDRRGCAATAVLSYGFWQSHFGGTESVLNSTLTINDQPFQIIGVSSPGFTGVEVGDKFDVAIPVCSAALFDGKRSRLDARSWWWLSIIGRLRPGITPEQANARLATLSPGIMSSALPQNWDAKSQQRFLQVRLTTVPAAAGISDLRRRFGDPLRALMVIVAVVLLIACANVATLMLARATARRQEIAIRKALGASRSRLVRQLLTESLVLSSVGALVGLLFAHWGTGLLVRNLSTGPRQGGVFLDLALDRRVLAFTAAVALLTAILVGFFPAVRSTSISLMAAMKGGQIVDEEGRQRFSAGKWIVSSQLALSLLLLVGGGLLLRTFVKLLTLDIGFDPSNVLIVNVNLDRPKIPVQERLAIYNEIGERFRTLPGVESVARSWTTPLGRREWNSFIRADSPNAPAGEQALVYFNFVSPSYFETLRTPLLAGRGFSDHDIKGAPAVAIVNQTVARKFFPGTDPIGRTFRVEQDDPTKPGPPIEIVGVVKDSKYESLREQTFPTAFFPILQPQDEDKAWFNQSNYELRTSVRPSTLIPAVQQAMANINKEVPLEFGTLNEQVDDSIVQERLLATLSSFFCALALLLAMIGLYGVISYLVTRRRTEFGVRMALGAHPSSILRLVMRDVLVVLIAGVAAGIGLSLATTTLLRKMLFGLAPHDTITILAAVVILSVMAILAGAIPARRASRVHPMVALRYE